MPPPIVQTPVTNVAPVFVPQPPPLSPPPPPAPPPPPPPPPRAVATKAVARSGGAIDDSFYPPSAIRNEESGTSVASFVIGTDGRVQSCSASGATPSLDAETCRQINKWRYKPAVGSDGQPIAEPRRQNVRWVLPKN
jgi:protein TonB